jgi:hypothetical protein
MTDMIEIPTITSARVYADCLELEFVFSGMKIVIAFLLASFCWQETSTRAAV